MKAKGKVIVVTGAAGGIGRELVIRLLASGARVVGIDMNKQGLHDLSQLPSASHSVFFPLRADITDLEVVEQIPRDVIDRFGSVDGIINNAGIIQPFIALADLPYATIQKVIDVNLFGTLFITKAFLPYLLDRPEAHIVNVSSMGGVVPFPGQTIYGATKAAVKLLTEGLAGELALTKVKVMVAIPGAVATNIMGNSGLNTPSQVSSARKGMLPLSPADAARIIVRGMEQDKYQVFVGKDSWTIDKLYRINPRFAASMIAKKMRAMIAK